jgi:Flp pilus assembly protein TadG
MLRRNRTRKNRAAAATVELAILLPLLSFLFVIAVDFARVFYPYLTITNSASSGALYASHDMTHATDLNGIQQVALADTSNLSPPPTVTSTIITDGAGVSHVEVTVAWPFKTVASYPGVPSSLTISRTVRMRVSPTVPRESF